MFLDFSFAYRSKCQYMCLFLLFLYMKCGKIYSCPVPCFLLCVCCCGSKMTSTFVIQASLELTVQPRLASNLGFSWLSLSSVRIADFCCCCYFARFFFFPYQYLVIFIVSINLQRDLVRKHLTIQKYKTNFLYVFYLDSFNIFSLF